VLSENFELCLDYVWYCCYHGCGAGMDVGSMRLIRNYWEVVWCCLVIVLLYILHKYGEWLISCSLFWTVLVEEFCLAVQVHYTVSGTLIIVWRLCGWVVFWFWNVIRFFWWEWVGILPTRRVVDWISMTTLLWRHTTILSCFGFLLWFEELMGLIYHFLS
jgi:hypothetical protein